MDFLKFATDNARREFRAPKPDGRTFCAYRLPDGRIVDVDASAAKDARVIQFTLADGTIVDAIQAGRNHDDYREYLTSPLDPRD